MEGPPHWLWHSNLRGITLRAKVPWKQEDVRFAARLADKYRGPRANRFLKTALEDATYLHATLNVNGTVEDPQWKVEANLGPQLASGLNRAVVRELEDRRDELAMKL